MSFEAGLDRFSATQVLDVVRDAIVIIDATDARFRILFANAAARKLFDYLGTPLLGGFLSNLLEPAAADAVRLAIAQLTPEESPLLRNIHWPVADLDLTSATELRLLRSPPSCRAVMLTLPSITSDFVRLGNISETRQFSQFLADAPNAPRIGGWEHRHSSGEVIWTDGLYRIFDTSPQDHVPSFGSICRLFPPEVKEKVFKPNTDPSKPVQSVEFETETTTFTDRKIWLHVIGQFETHDGAVVRSYGAVQDITAQKVAQLTLNRITEWLKLSTQTPHIYAWRWDRATAEFDFVGSERSSDCPPPDFRSMEDFFERVHPEDRARWSSGMRITLEEGVDLKEEFRIRRSDGTYRCYAAAGRPLLDADKRVTGLVVAAQDVTHRRALQARVNENSVLLRAASANTADVLLLLDAHLNIRFCNRSFGGFNAEELTGLNIHKVLGAADWEAQSQLFTSVLTHGVPVTFEHEALGDDGEVRHYESRAIPVYDRGAITGLSITISDITERKRLKREILEISSREQERIGQDLHDGLGQELTGVALMLRALATKIHADYPTASSDIEEIVGVVNHSIASARALARGLSPVDSSRGGVVHALRALAVRGRQLYGLDVRFRSKIWPQLTLDGTCCSHLYRIAQEALTNVARHAKATQVDIRLHVAENKFSLTVADNGVGLDAPFKSHGGMGLKLMTYRAGMINAKLEILPNEPKGTMIRISGEQPRVV
jgi:PAS domain S-box-containing protein